MKELFKNIIKDFHKRKLPEFKERNIKIPLDSNKIVSIIGSRRAGKTYLMYQLISKIKDITNIIYINFEDERLDLKNIKLNEIIESYFELYPKKEEKEIYFFFDEIQEVNDWEKFVRRIYDTISKKIFITGASAKLLSKELATSLRGRTINYELFPLSFKEYLQFKDVEIDLNSTKGKANIFSELNNYMLNGGFPETVNQENNIRKKTLTNYFDVMMYRDIVERHNVTNILPLKLLLKRLLSNVSKDFTINKIYNDLKSEGIKISKDQLYKYLDYCEDAYLLFSISNFSESKSKQIIKKIYSIDTGLSLIVSFSLSKNYGRLLENIVYIELKRREQEIYYSKEKETECDFLIKENDKIIQAIQVCYALSEDNKEREIKGLKIALEKFKLKEGLIITLDKEEIIGNIKIIPVTKWLLNQK